MNVVRSSARCVGLVAAVAAILAGCASVERAVPKAPDIAQQRQQRNRAAARRLEHKRDAAELEAATARWQQGDLDGAEEILERLLARSPDHVEARLLMAELLLTGDRAGEAIAQLKPALARSGEDARVQHMMGLVLDATGQSSRALEFYEQAVRLEPHNQVYAVSYETAAASETDSGGVPEPEAPGHSLEDSVPASGQSSPKPIIRVREADSAQSADSAEPSGRFADRASGTAGGLIEQGVASLSAGRTELALAYFQKAMSVKPDDPQIPVSAAVRALRHSRPEVAVALAGPSMEVFPDSAALARVLGAAYYRLGDYRSSQVALQQALSLDKSSALSYFLMGCTLVKLGESQGAEVHFRQARRLDPRYAVQR